VRPVQRISIGIRSLANNDPDTQQWIDKHTAHADVTTMTVVVIMWRTVITVLRTMMPVMSIVVAMIMVTMMTTVGMTIMVTIVAAMFVTIIVAAVMTISVAITVLRVRVEDTVTAMVIGGAGECRQAGQTQGGHRDGQCGSDSVFHVTPPGVVAFQC